MTGPVHNTAYDVHLLCVLKSHEFYILNKHLWGVIILITFMFMIVGGREDELLAL